MATRGRKLVAYVYVDGECYGPDSELPEDVAAKITNPKAWGEEPEAAEESEPEKAPSRRRGSASK